MSSGDESENSVYSEDSDNSSVQLSSSSSSDYIQNGHTAACYRKHMSGQRYLICMPMHCLFAIEYVPRRNGLIGLSWQKYNKEIRGHPKELKIRYLWKLRSKREIIERLDIICFGHQVTMSWKKVAMLKEWVKCENPMESDATIRPDMNKYSWRQLRYLTGMLCNILWTNSLSTHFRK